MDGVLVNSTQIAQKAISAGNIGLTEEMQKEVLCGNFHEEMEKYSHLKKPETEEEKKLRKLQYAEAKSAAPLYEGIEELLAKLHELKYILVLNTSAYDRNCLPILKKYKVDHMFDLIATAELSKSKVEKFKLIEEKYKAHNEDVLFVTDTLGDIREADMAGVLTVAVTWGGHDESFFKREKHNNLIKIIDTVAELEDFILKY